MFKIYNNKTLGERNDQMFNMIIQFVSNVPCKQLDQPASNTIGKKKKKDVFFRGMREVYTLEEQTRGL